MRFGTQAENIKDMEHAGNFPRGENNGLAKLTVPAVQDIRARYAGGTTKKALAQQFGVTFMTIHAVIIRKTWKHVP